MSRYQTTEYNRIHDGAKRLHKIILNEEADDALAIKAIATLMDVEAYKAELRGRPRIKPAELREAPQAQRNARRVTTPAAPKPIASKESLSPKQP